MDEKEIKRTWRNLLIPFIIGSLILIAAILFNRLGSKKATPQTLSLFAGIAGFVFMAGPGLKMFKFWKYLKELKK